VHVLYNADLLFDADINGYGGDPAFHEIKGTARRQPIKVELGWKRTTSSLLPSDTQRIRRITVTPPVCSPIFYCSLWKFDLEYLYETALDHVGATQFAPQVPRKAK
jgi:hypothetical protein